MTRKNVIIICVVVIGIIFLIKWIYPVLGISDFYPPIKEYSFSLSTNELNSKMGEVCNDDSNLTCTPTDTTGTLKNGFNYYFDIHLKEDSVIYLFNLSYNKVDEKHSKINLIGAFDTAHQLGGYQNDDQGVQKLINIFEHKFINKIQGVY